MEATIEPTPYDQLFFDQFRFGQWPGYFDGVQVDQSPETLNQFLRSVTPNTGPYDPGVLADATSALIDRIEADAPTSLKLFQEAAAEIPLPERPHLADWIESFQQQMEITPC